MAGGPTRILPNAGEDAGKNDKPQFADLTGEVPDTGGVRSRLAAMKKKGKQELKKLQNPPPNRIEGVCKCW